MDDNAAGTITFSGTSKALNSGTSTAVNLTDNAGATINFTGGGLDIDTQHRHRLQRHRRRHDHRPGRQQHGQLDRRHRGQPQRRHRRRLGRDACRPRDSDGGARGVNIDTVTGPAASTSAPARFRPHRSARSTSTAAPAASPTAAPSATAAGLSAEISGRTGGTVTHRPATSTTPTTPAAAFRSSTTPAARSTFSGATKTLNTGAQHARRPGRQHRRHHQLHRRRARHRHHHRRRASRPTGGGTVNVTGAATRSPPTTGTALNVANTTIGASDLTFQSISAGTGAGSAGVGISLDTTGSLGGLHVTGDGGDAGTVPTRFWRHHPAQDRRRRQQHDGIGIYLNNTTDVQLAGMQLNDFDNFAIRGNLVTGFRLTDSKITGVERQQRRDAVQRRQRLVHWNSHDRVRPFRKRRNPRQRNQRWRAAATFRSTMRPER